MLKIHESTKILERERYNMIHGMAIPHPSINPSHLDIRPSMSTIHRVLLHTRDRQSNSNQSHPGSSWHSPAPAGTHSTSCITHSCITLSTSTLQKASLGDIKSSTAIPWVIVRHRFLFIHWRSREDRHRHRLSRQMRSSARKVYRVQWFDILWQVLLTEYYTNYMFFK